MERNNIRNFNSLVDWLEKFNKGEDVPFLTMSGRDLGSAIALIRVIGGVHFPRDVIAGALIGIIFGIIGWNLRI